MKKTIFILLTAFVSILLLKAFRQNYQSSKEQSVILENVEALTNGESSPSGVYYDCNDEICIVFDYKNRFLARGCKAADGYICTVQKTELPDISL